jgi:DNA-binding GntR family transcriptional regulator
MMGAVLQQSRRRQAVWDEHEAVAGAIAAGDGDKAARLIEQHSQRAGEDLAARLTEALQSAQASTDDFRAFR